MKNINNLLKNLKNNTFEFLDDLNVETLEKLIIYTADKYYNTDNPVVSDSIYDTMIEFLQKKNPKSKVLKEIGSKVKNIKKRVKLDYHLGSMDKIKPGDKNLNKWFTKYKKPYYISDKLDGISALLVIKNNKMKMFTRGTSSEGLDISRLIKYLKLPSMDKINKIIKKAGKGKVNDLALRGELIMKKSVFEKNWSKTKKNVRNTISGLVNSKTIDPHLANDTDLVIYEIVDPFIEFDKMINLLKNDFITVNYVIKEKLDEKILTNILIDRKKNSDYDVDGIIVTNNEKHKRNTSGNPKYAFAFKDLMEDMIKETIVKDIEWKISKDGKIIPTVIIEPIELGGVEINRVTGNNAKFIVDNKINKNTKLKITRSGDVIPKIVKIIKSSKEPLMPTIEYKWNKTKVDIIANDDHEDIIIRNLQYFFSSLDIKGFGPKVVEKLYNNNFNTIEKILKMSIDEYQIIDGFKLKTAENLFNNLHDGLKGIKLEDLMSASNIFGSGFGSRRIKMILNIYPNILKDYKKWKNDEFLEKIKSIDGFDTITASQFVSNFKNYVKFHKMISKYISLKTNKKQNKKLENFNIVMSGFRDKELKEKILNLGGKITESISKNTTYLIVKDKDVITSKISKAKKLNIKIVDKDEFNQILNKF